MKVTRAKMRVWRWCHVEELQSPLAASDEVFALPLTSPLFIFQPAAAALSETPAFFLAKGMQTDEQCWTDRVRHSRSVGRGALQSEV